jgi:DNA-binding response OmpR family regulator
MQALIIEDDNALRKAYQKILEREGFTVSAVSNAVDAFEKIMKTNFDVVVCDVALPALEGTTFFELLTQRYPQTAQRVLFVTGFAKDENTRKLLEHTGRPYLTKPVDLKVFLTAVMRTAQGSAAK